MIPDIQELLSRGWEIEDPDSDPVIIEGLPLFAERKFLHLWPRLDRGIRWILMDLLRRYSREVDERRDDLSEAPGWARIRIGSGAGISATAFGDVTFRLMLPTKSRKSPPHIKLTFVNDEKSFACWPEDLTPAQGQDRILPVTAANLQRVRIAISPQQKQQRDQAPVPDIDPVAEAIIARIPPGLREHVLRSIVLHRLTFHITNAIGEAGAIHAPVLGVEAISTKGKSTIVPTGYLTESIYFQNGWLMVKLANLPHALQVGIQTGDKSSKGTPAEDLFDVHADDGADGRIRLFHGLEIEKRRRGRTWMGEHLTLKFGRQGA